MNGYQIVCEALLGFGKKPINVPGIGTIYKKGNVYLFPINIERAKFMYMDVIPDKPIEQARLKKMLSIYPRLRKQSMLLMQKEYNQFKKKEPDMIDTNIKNLSRGSALISIDAEKNFLDYSLRFQPPEFYTDESFNVYVKNLRIVKAGTLQ
jgi:hypothetical protein